MGKWREKILKLLLYPYFLRFLPRAHSPSLHAFLPIESSKSLFSLSIIPSVFLCALRALCGELLLPANRLDDAYIQALI